MNQLPKIGLITATIVGINAMIGAGIFSTPTQLLSSVGPAGIISYLFVVVAIWCMASSFARLGQRFPQEGSFYAYARQWGGHTAGLIASGSYLLGILIAMGLLLQLSGYYLHEYLPSIPAYYLGLIVISLLAIITMLGGRATQTLQFVALGCTTLPLVAITAMCLSKADFANLSPFAPYGFGNVFRATQAIIFGFFGFESVASLFAIVKNPERTVPRALTYAILFVSLIYFLFIFSIMLAVPAASVATATTPLPHILRDLFPSQTWLITILHFSITASFLSVLNAMLFATANLFVALIKTTRARTLLPKNSLPVATVCMSLLIAVSYTTLNNIDLFFNFTALFVIAAFVTAFMALFTTRQTRAEKIQLFAGLITAGIILFFALEGIMRHFLKGH